MRQSFFSNSRFRLYLIKIYDSNVAVNFYHFPCTRDKGNAGRGPTWHIYAGDDTALRWPPSCVWLYNVKLHWHSVTNIDLSLRRGKSSSASWHSLRMRHAGKPTLQPITTGQDNVYCAEPAREPLKISPHRNWAETKPDCSEREPEPNRHVFRFKTLVQTQPSFTPA